MSNRTESCYEKTPQTCKFYAGNGKPIVRRVRLIDKDGNEAGVCQSHNDYKRLRKVVKAKKRKARKENGK